MVLSTIGACLRTASARLRDFSPSPGLDAEILLSSVLERPRSYLYTWPERHLEPAQLARFEALLARREQGEPVAYLTGRREFWSLDLRVCAATLIPRPETELLVSLALERLAGTRGPVLDLGTGSGAVAVAIARERADLQVIATDIDSQALVTAADNARRLGLNNLCWRQGDWFEALEDAPHFAMVLSNPPYVAEDDPHLAVGDVRFEPRRALVAGTDGLAAIRRIIAGAGAHLRAGGWLLLEHGHTQAAAVMALLRDHGFDPVSDHRDEAGRPRVAAGRLP